MVIGLGDLFGGNPVNVVTIATWLVLVAGILARANIVVGGVAVIGVIDFICWDEIDSATVGLVDCVAVIIMLGGINFVEII